MPENLSQKIGPKKYVWNTRKIKNQYKQQIEIRSKDLKLEGRLEIIQSNSPTLPWIKQTETKRY